MTSKNFKMYVGPSGPSRAMGPCWKFSPAGIVMVFHIPIKAETPKLEKVFMFIITHILLFF